MKLSEAEIKAVFNVLWYFGRVEERWTANLSTEPAPTTESV